MRDIKLPLVVAVFVGVVIIGLGARSLYFQKRVIDPMAQAASEIPGVLSVDVKTSPDGLKDVHVHLGPDVQLEKVYTQLEEIATDTFGSGLGRLVLEDERSDALSEAYYQIHFTIQQGISTGLFASMAEEIDRQAREANLPEHRIFVGDRLVYIQLHEGDHYLYEVVPRRELSAQVGAGAGGWSRW